MVMNPKTPEAYRLFHEGSLALARAEREGIRIDTEYCTRKAKQLDYKIAKLEEQLKQTKLYKHWAHIHGAKTNIYSNHQLSNLLYKHLKLSPEKTTDSGQGATDEEALTKLGIPELDLILEARKLLKIKNTYLEGFVRENVNGYIHPFFHLHLVRTFRSSSSDPNFQNIPKRDKQAMKICRKAIIPRPGHMFLEADYSALEVNISECYHKDPVMKKYLLDKSTDMHGDMAKQIFMLDELNKKLPAHATLRQAAKNGFVFPQFYGDYYGNNAEGLCAWIKLPRTKWKDGEGLEMPDGSTISTHLRQHGIKSFDQFVEHLKHVEDDFWNRRFKVYNQWRKQQVSQYHKLGYLHTHTGFTCSGLMRKNEIVNYPIQGSAFHCLLFTFIELDKISHAEKWKTKLVGQIHDSIVLDTHPDELEHVKKTLHNIVSKTLREAWDWIIVPLEIEIEEYDVDAPWIH